MNLKELSLRLGLSQTTVSRALNGYPDVGEETRRRVEEAARALDYRPSSTARRLALGRTGTIGILFPFVGGLSIDPHFAEFLSGVAEAVAETDADVCIIPTRVQPGRETLRPSRLRSVDAVILSGPALDDERVAVLRRSRVPFVVHGRLRGAEDYAFLDIDNEGAFRRAADLLLDLGHRRIALLNGDTALAFASRRRDGWQSALAGRGIAPEAALHREGTMSEEHGHDWTAALLAGPSRPTAFLCSSMILALGCCRALREAGLAIGRDVSVIAHDDGMPAIRPQTMHPALTTTSSSIRLAGARIAAIAMALGEGADPLAFREIWPADLLLRDSTGRAPPA